jgi:hypothetical protein
MWPLNWLRKTIRKLTHSEHSRPPENARPENRTPDNTDLPGDSFGALSEVAAPAPIQHPEREPEDILEKQLSGANMK